MLKVATGRERSGKGLEILNKAREVLNSTSKLVKSQGIVNLLATRFDKGFFSFVGKVMLFPKIFLWLYCLRDS